MSARRSRRILPVHLSGKLQFLFVPIPFRADLRVFLAEFIEEHSGIRLGRMFGLPAGYVGRRLFVCLMEDGIIVRLPPDLADREIATGSATRHTYSRSPGAVRKPGSGRPGRGAVARWVKYRPRTIVDARRLVPLLEVAARHIAERQVEEVTGLTISKRR
jgi:hypothetical protein